MNEEIVQEIIETLKAKDNFLISAHINPEGDSIGSQLSMYYILKKMGKKAVMAGYYIVPENLRFLSGVESISEKLPEGFQPEVAIVLDCPTKDRLGKAARYLEGVQLIVNIDHHISNNFFGNINWVEPESSSVGEMIYGIVEKLEMGIDRNIGEALYAAIVTDTGMFNYDNTSGRTHRIAGALIESGINPKAMHSNIFENKSLSQIKMLGRVLATIEVEEDGKLAYMCLTRKMHEEEGVRSVATEEFINYPRSIKGVEVAVFFKERLSAPGSIDVSFRSSERINVDTIAACFGGGGHKRASGCVIKGALEEVQGKVLAEARSALRENRQ
ncbi:MAG: bifunctional oligoribonuclease/PAP phosphatase NrnA [Candidatus Omnitrophota bacterium]|jgi:phosphoesterase RecJ-like protein